MSGAFLDDDRDLAAEFPVALFEDARLAVEPRVTAAADVQERHAGLRQCGEAVEGLGLLALQEPSLRNEAKEMVEIFAGRDKSDEEPGADVDAALGEE